MFVSKQHEYLSQPILIVNSEFVPCKSDGSFEIIFVIVASVCHEIQFQICGMQLLVDC